MKNFKLLLALLSLFASQALFANNGTPVNDEITQVAQELVSSFDFDALDNQEEVALSDVVAVMRSQMDASYAEWEKQVLGLMIENIELEGFTIKRDTNITIFGSGGMTDAGRICPDKCSGCKCATIVIHGLAVIDDGGLTDPVGGELFGEATGGKTFDVTLLEMSGAKQVGEADYDVEGSNVTVELR